MKRQKGFTLIETVLYLPLLAVIMGGGLIASYQVIEGTQATFGHVMLQEEANFLLRKIDWAVRDATSVTVDKGNLIVVKESLDGLIFITINQSGKELLIRTNDQMSQPLNSASIDVNNISFDKVLDTVTTDFTLTIHGPSGKPISQVFSQNIILNEKGI